MNNKDIKIFKGNIIFAKIIDKLETIKDGYIILNKNKVVKVLKVLSEEYSDYYYEDFGNKLIIPGLVDMHVHAPQFANRGLGLDMELLPWLNNYTFPEELKFASKSYAINVYQAFINCLWENGITRSIVFSSLHIKTTELLFNLFIKSWLGAYVGKINMDYSLDSTSELTETTAQSLSNAEYFIKKFNNKKELVKQIITPRLALSCTRELLAELGNLAKKYQVPAQTHLSENKDEILQTKVRFPEIKDYIDVYINAGLLDTKAVLAHCVLSSDSEIKKIKKHNAFIAHCPESNLNLISGIARIKDYLEKKINVGLGSDVSAGHTCSIDLV